MDWVYLLNSFEGRIGRQTFWIAMVVVGIANVLVCLIAQEFGGERLSAIVDLAFTYPEFAVGAKRGHDRNLPLWLLGVFFAANAAARPSHRARPGAGPSEEPSVLSVVDRGAVHARRARLAGRLGFRKTSPPFSLTKFILTIVAITGLITVLGILSHLLPHGGFS